MDQNLQSLEQPVASGLQSLAVLLVPDRNAPTSFLPESERESGSAASFEPLSSLTRLVEDLEIGPRAPISNLQGLEDEVLATADGFPSVEEEASSSAMFSA